MLKRFYQRIEYFFYLRLSFSHFKNEVISVTPIIYIFNEVPFSGSMATPVWQSLEQTKAIKIRRNNFISNG